MKKVRLVLCNFATNELLKSNLLEVAFQDISGKESSPTDKHLPTASVEINIIIAEKVSANINGKHFDIYQGEFYVLWPETIIENISANQKTQIIVIKAPISMINKTKLNHKLICHKKCAPHR
jgi:hypothetical protein